MLGYDSLINHYRTNFSLMQHHKYSLSDLENMLPWEKFMYVDMLKQFIQHQEDLQRDQAAQMKSQHNLRRR